MAGSDALHLALTGVPSVVVLAYLLDRLTDRIVFLVGLWMVLRATRREDRVAAIVAYRGANSSAGAGRQTVRRRLRIVAEPPRQPEQRPTQ